MPLTCPSVSGPRQSANCHLIQMAAMGRNLSLSLAAVARSAQVAHFPPEVSGVVENRATNLAVGDATKIPRWQRVATRWRERDWTGIAIEFAVVTLGILLAFQIDQWGQNQRRDREERQFLERMWQETAEAIDENEWVMTLHGRFRREFIEGFAALNDPAALARLAQTPNVGCRSAVMPGLGFNNTSFQELSASGRLNLISDPQLRAELRDVVSAQADAEAQRDNAFFHSLDAQRTLEQYYVLGIDANDNRTCRMDWIRLARDPNARNALVRSARLHSMMWTRRAYVRDTLALAHNRIACSLNKSDCSSKVPQIFRVRPRYDIIPPEAQQAVEQSAEMYNGS